MLDLKIINGTVIDGTGRPGFRADVGIRNGRIVTIGKIDEAAKRTIDAEGKTVAPGFVDVHTHYDAQIFWDPAITPSCFHGVTSILGGFCGFSVAPLTKDAGGYLMRMLARVEGMPLSTLEAGVPWDWSSFASYLAKHEGRLALNAGFFVGHSAVRRVVMGERAVGDKASPAEIAQMEKLVDDSIREGALGFSTTVSVSHNDADGNPVPSRHASREELLTLAAVVSRHEGTSLELLPNLDFGDDTVQLLTDFSLAGRRPVNWNVMTVTGADQTQLERIDRQLKASDYARSKGAEVVALTLPFSPSMRVNLYSGFIFDSFPGWAPLFRLPIAERIEKLQDPAYRQQLSDGATSPEAGIFRALSKWDTYLLDEVHSEQYKALKGLSLEEAGKRLGRTPFDVMMDIACADGLKTSFMPKIGGEDQASYELRARLWKDDRTIVGASDAGAHMDMIDTFAFATKMLEKGVREHKVITLEEAVHQLTQVPAGLMGLRERGVLQEGWHADVVVFDPLTVGSGPTYTRFDLPGNEGRLYADAIGVEHVIVNGTPVVSHNELTGERPGTVFHSGRDTYTVKIPADR